METKDSSEKANTGQSLRKTVWKKNVCYWFTFWRDLNMVEEKGWFRSKRLRQRLDKVVATPTWGMLDQQALIPFPSCGEWE